MTGSQVRPVDDQKICLFLFFFFLFFFSFSILVWLAKSDVVHIIHQGLSVSSVSNRLLNQEMSIEKGITCSYTPEGYIAFVFPFVCSYVRSLLSVALVEFTTKFSVKVSLSGYISPTTHQVPYRVCFHTMSIGPRVHAPVWDWGSKTRTPLKCVFLQICFENNLCGQFVKNGSTLWHWLVDHEVKVSMTYISRFNDFALYLEDYLMYEHDSLG